MFVVFCFYFLSFFFLFVLFCFVLFFFFFFFFFFFGGGGGGVEGKEGMRKGKRRNANVITDEKSGKKMKINGW